MGSARSETVVHSVRADEGELRFSVDLAGRRCDLWATTDLPVVPTGDVALAFCLLPAMTVGGTLRIEAPVDRTLLARVEEIQAVLRSWARAGDWPKASVLAHEVRVECEVAEPRPRRPDREVASFFTGGVDSFFTVLGEPEVSHLIYVSGLDVPLDQPDLDARVRARLGAAADGLGRSLTTGRTNVRELGDGLVPWAVYFGSVLGGLARMHSPEFRRVHLASSVEHAHLLELGSHPLLDHLWGGDGLDVIHDGAHATRAEKVARIAGDAGAQRTLRVCWENPAGDYNCGRCEKCLRTMVNLELLGVRERFRTLPAELDLEAVAATRPAARPEVRYWTELLELALEVGADPALIQAVTSCLQNVDVPTRARDDAAPPRRERAAVRAREPALYMRPRDWTELRSMRAVVFLIGGYDGSGNYGDIAQLQAALELLAPLGEAGVALLPVLDLRYLEAHRRARFAPSPGFDPARFLVYAPVGGAWIEITGRHGLVPAAVPPGVQRAGTYLYGGGYLNRRWADRMLSMIGAADELTETAAIPGHAHFATGLQIEADWAAGLGRAKRAVLSQFAGLGGRDELSVGAARALSQGRGERSVANTGDDAVGVFATALNGRPAGGGGGEASLNLHMCLEPWVTGEPERLLAFSAELVDRYARASGRKLVLQPVIAYEDGRVSERAGLERLVETARAAGMVERVDEPIVLGETAPGAALATLSRSELTIGSSYHVALVSLLAGVPAVLLNENDYYAQKAYGLRRDFSLPDAFFPSASADPGRVAQELRAAVGAPEAAATLRRDLDRGRAAMLERRRGVEREVLEFFQAALTPPAAEGTGDPVVHARELENALAALDHAQRRAEYAEGLAEARQELLDRVERSMAWRLTAPLRALRRNRD